MKKLLLALTLIVGSMGYVVIQRGLDEQGATVASTAIQTSSETTPVSEAQAAVQTVTTTSNQTATTISTAKKGQYTDGTFTGSTESQPYGSVQVAVVVSGGRITNVKLLQKPSQGGQTQEINSQALPMLVDEVITAQSGNIDGVSGASLTSPAFIESVKSALSKAKA